MSPADLIQELRKRLPGISTPAMRGDNLAIILCSAFDNPDQPDDDDTGWTPDAIAGFEEVIAAIHAHYADSLASKDTALAEIRAENERLRKAVRATLTWAEQRCPCRNEEPNPCPLCGASVENLEGCKSAENTLPRHILESLRAASRAISQDGEER